jgi:endonuclease/exonuclease/phosphatase family metal-dependent hydrolase
VQTLRLLTWNLKHGRDDPPEEGLEPLRSKIPLATVRGKRYAQVNRSLKREFLDVVHGLDWDVALLQEAPPRWHGSFDAQGACALTDRNSFAPLRGLLQWLSPDLIASNEGGSNQLLVRAPWRLGEKREHVVAIEPERRVMMMGWLAAPDGRQLVVANLHANKGDVPGSADQVLAAAGRAVELAGDLPLVFGGDLNQRPAKRPELFDELERQYGLAPPTGPRHIDHLLVRGLEIVEPPRALPDEVREVERPDGLRLQLSDHPCVAAVAGMK